MCVVLVLRESGSKMRWTLESDRRGFVVYQLCALGHTSLGLRFLQ